MIGLSVRWSSSVTKLLMVAPLMPYGLLFIQRPCGLYAHHLHGWACGLKVCQLYDKPVILVLVNYPKIIFLELPLGVSTCWSWVVGQVCAQPTTDQIELGGGNLDPSSTGNGVKLEWSDFALESGWFGQSHPRWRNPTKTVHFRRNLTRSDGDLAGSSENLLNIGRFPPNLAEISLDLVRSP